MPSFSIQERGVPVICGHRGNSLAAPENTLSALRAAAAVGGTGVEVDAVLSGDGEIMIFHDLMLDRTTNGSGPVFEKSFAELEALDAGTWFSPEFTGEKIPTLRQMLNEAHRLDLMVELEIKEVRNLAAMLDALERSLEDPRDRDRVMLVSFDHAWLKHAKARLGAIRTGGIALARYGNPRAVAEDADLDQLCIDLAYFHPDDARALHAGGKTIRCHAYDPHQISAAERAGLGWHQALLGYVRDGLIDTLSGDDVAWLAALVCAAGYR